MGWKELEHNINRGMTEYFKAIGKKPNIIILGKEDHDVLVNHFSSQPKSVWDVITGAPHHNNDVNHLSMWGMEVHLDASKESVMEFDRKEQDFFNLADEESFNTYRMKIDILIPLKFRAAFTSFIGKQSDMVGVQFVKIREEISRDSNDVYFHIHVAGMGKGVVEAWVEYIVKISELLKSKEKENAEEK